MARFLCLALLLLPALLRANIAMPGFFGAGVAGDFSLHFEEDSLYRDQLQMVEEEVRILLYPGFAVVGGTYRLRNLGPEPVRVRLGYPVHQLLEPDRAGIGDYYELDVEDLYALETWIHGQSVPVTPLTLPELEDDWGRSGPHWYVWETDFPAAGEVVVEVRFIVDTHRATVREGYHHEAANGFIYLLESGRPWAGVIEKGTFVLRLMGGLGLDDLEGLEPDGRFQALPEPATLWYDFTALEPGPEDNLLLRYGQRPDTVDIAALIEQTAVYYAQLSLADPAKVDTAALAPFSRPGLFSAAGIGGTLVSGAMLAMIYGPPLLLLLTVVIVVVVVVRRYRRRRA